jgi:predicted DNA-binding protein
MEYAFNLRLPAELMNRIDQVRGQITKASGVPVTRAMVIRSILEKGVERYYQEKASTGAKKASSVPVAAPKVEVELPDMSVELPCL